MDWQRVREDFGALQNHTYLNSAGIGITPRPVTAEIQRLFGEWGEHGATTPTFRDQVRAVSDATVEHAARLFNAKPEELAFTGRVAESLHIVTDGLDWRPGDEILTSDEEVLYAPLYRVAQDHGVAIKTVRLPHDREELLSRIEDALTSRTRLVWLSDTTNKTGIHLPAREICDLAHGKNALVMYDGAQTAGQFAVDLRAIDCDYYAITGYKWLLGPYGCGLCYVREEAIPQVRALRVGRHTIDHSSSNYTQADDATRYDFGVRNVILRAGFGRALEYMAAIGIDQVRSRVTALRDHLWTQLDRIPGMHIASPRDPSLNSAITCLVVEGVEPQQVVSKAWEANIVIVPTELPPSRPDLRGVRISPHCYNTEVDLDRIVDVVSSMAKA